MARFAVIEVDGWPIGAGPQHRATTDRPMLSCSVIDRGICTHPEVARFNQEDVGGYGSLSYEARREALRARARGLAAMLEAEHAEP